jgi:hypothetical protein
MVDLLGYVTIQAVKKTKKVWRPFDISKLLYHLSIIQPYLTSTNQHDARALHHYTENSIHAYYHLHGICTHLCTYNLYRYPALHHNYLHYIHGHLHLPAVIATSEGASEALFKERRRLNFVVWETTNYNR